MSLVLQLLRSRYDLLEEIQVFHFSFYKLSPSFYMFPKFRFIECNIDASVWNGYSTAIWYLHLDQLWISLLSSFFCKKETFFFNRGRKLHLSLYIKYQHLENGWELYQSRNIVLVVSSLAPMTSPVEQRNSFAVLGMNFVALRILSPIWQVLVALEI